MANLKVPYFKERIGKKGVSYYFSPPSYVVKQVWEKSDKTVVLKARTLSKDYDTAVKECLAIYAKQIRPFLKRYIELEGNKQSFHYIWMKFCERRGIGCEAKGNGLLDRPLAPHTKKDYQNSYDNLCKVRNENGKRLVDINADLISPQTVDKIYLKLYAVCKERWAHNGMDLLRLLFNFGHDKLGVLKNNNPFNNQRYPRTKHVKRLWSPDMVALFDEKARELGYADMGLAVRMNMYTAQRPADFLSLTMEQLKEKDGMHYFELTPQKTASKGVVAYAPIPEHIYNEIKDREGLILRQKDGRPYGQRTFEKHYQKIIHSDERLKGLSFQATRNSAGTAYHEAGTTTAQNMTVLGHTQQNTNLSIYRQNTAEQALEALRKRMEHEKNKKRG